ncbi:hypothetical protein BS297_09455 [Rhodococcus erythropolis]|uniref:Integrase catalytic domain-containing protein n=1 Tax=Rhodococcus erythropolis TaxID=1833 RepID=A0A5N5E5Q3_RHOER|nr:hypothetical protein BS297_09455 [Rhodococcus erythropolis]
MIATLRHILRNHPLQQGKEGDLIVGKDAGSAIGTLVERKTRMIRLLHLTRRDGQTVRQALIERMGDLPPDLLRSITWDQGTEMAQHRAITAALGVPVYFCDSRSPWQRGSNENSNGLLRDYFPKRRPERAFATASPGGRERTQSPTPPSNRRLHSHRLWRIMLADEKRSARAPSEALVQAS